MYTRRSVRFVPALAGSVLTALACSSPERTTAPATRLPAGAATQISDATGGGEPHFYWLPPIAAARTYPGTFDGAVNPELRLCRLTGAVCGAAIATYTRTSSPAITVSTASQAYSLDWSTKPASITNGDYRAEVWVAGRRLGLADARVVASAKDLKSVPAGFVGVQSGKSLTFNFRLEAGIVGSITVAPQKPTIETGATRQLTATVLDIRGAPIAGAPVVWTSSAPAVATVSSTGLVTGVSENTTIITATSGAVSAKDTVVIVRPTVAQVVVNPSGTSVQAGQTDTLWATTYDARGNILTGRPITWSSSNTAVATVGQGIVTGVAPGSVSITATSEGVSGSESVTVTQAIVARVAVAPQLVSLTVGQTATFTATAYDAANNVLSGRPTTWLSSDTAVVMVAPNGVATATGPGLVYVMATSGNASDSGRVEVTGATVTCLRPWALPQLWFISNPYGRAVRARYGTPNELSTVWPGTISGNYYPVALGGSSSGQYVDNVVTCSPVPVTLGAPNPLAVGNLVEPTLAALDSLFKLDQGATWDSTANGGLGAIVSSNAPPGAESARVVLVGLYDIRDHPPGTSSVRFRRTAWVFVDTYSRETYWDTNEVKGDIVFRFLRFGP